MIVREVDITEFKELKKKGLSNSEVAEVTGFSSSTIHVYTSKTNGLKECEGCGKHKQKALFKHCVGKEMICKSCLRQQVRKAKEKQTKSKCENKPHFLCFMGLTNA